MVAGPVKLTFTIDRDDLPAERIEEYKRLLNEMLGIDGDWQVIPRTLSAQKHEPPSVTN